MHNINLIPEITPPRFLNDPEQIDPYFLVGETNQVVIFTDGYEHFALPEKTDVFVCEEELFSHSCNILRVYLTRNYRFTADVLHGMVGPAS